MQNYDIIATHSCGHKERRTGGTTTSVEHMLDFFSNRKCSACKPTCGYCNRTADREKMLVFTDGRAFCNQWCHRQSLHPTHYREHNDIRIPGFLIDWEDHSYHNDTCARSEYSIGPHAICIWVEHDAPADRDDESCDKYVVEFARDTENYGFDGNVLYKGDDAAIVALWAHAAEIVDCGPGDDDDAAAAPMVARIRELIAAANMPVVEPEPDFDEFDEQEKH